jgi:hypothetical protein
MVVLRQKKMERTRAEGEAPAQHVSLVLSSVSITIVSPFLSYRPCNHTDTHSLIRPNAGPIALGLALGDATFRRD